MALSPELALRLNELGFDAVHASELNLSRAADTIILSTALEQGRVVITADLDFPRLLSILGASGPGLILLRGGNYSEPESFECVRRVLMAIPHDELTKSVVVVDRVKIRRRWLPL
jgi:predicted nuclease of predicted toxin-antitoxin system